MIIEKNYEEIKPGDAIWWNGYLVEVVKPLPSSAMASRFRGEILDGPLAGTMCMISGLPYTPARVQIKEKSGHDAARA